MLKPNLFDVTDRIYAITGAGGALCGVMAVELAARGARVALLDLDHEAAKARARTITDAGGRALALQCDVLDEAGIAACEEAIEQEWGIPEVLINGAGGNHPSGSTDVEFVQPEMLDATADPATGASTFFDLPTDGFSRVFDLNFLGTVLPTRVIGKRIAVRGGGAVINMSSMSALTALTKVGAYSAAKSAVANFTSWLAVHLAPTGVRVNALAPGFFMTEQLRFLHIDRESGEYTPRAKAAIAHTPMRRYGEPEELVGAVIWLTTEASSFVTGIVLPIDGGFSSYSI